MGNFLRNVFYIYIAILVGIVIVGVVITGFGNENAGAEFIQRGLYVAAIVPFAVIWNCLGELFARSGFHSGNLLGLIFLVVMGGVFWVYLLKPLFQGKVGGSKPH